MQNIIQKRKTLWIDTRASFLALTCLKHLIVETLLQNVMH